MPNKREFKKYADAMGASVIDEMVVAYHNVKDADKDKITKAIKKTLGAVGAAKSNADITFDKGAKAFESMAAYSKAKRQFFKSLFFKIETEFIEEINQALKDFNDALPPAEKAKNKEIAQGK